MLSFGMHKIILYGANCFILATWLSLLLGLCFIIVVTVNSFVEEQTRMDLILNLAVVGTIFLFPAVLVFFVIRYFKARFSGIHSLFLFNNALSSLLVGVILFTIGLWLILFQNNAVDLVFNQELIGSATKSTSDNVTTKENNSAQGEMSREGTETIQQFQMYTDHIFTHLAPDQEVVYAKKTIVDGKKVMYAIIWQTATTSRVVTSLTVDNPDEIYNLKVSTRNKKIAGKLNGDLVLIDGMTGDQHSIYQHSTSSTIGTTVAFSTDESKLAFITSDYTSASSQSLSTLHLYNLKTEELISSQSGNLPDPYNFEWNVDDTLTIADNPGKACISLNDVPHTVVDAETMKVIATSAYGFVREINSEIPEACLNISEMCQPDIYAQPRTLEIYRDFTRTDLRTVIQASQGSYLNVVALSPDKEQVLYRVIRVDSRMQCNYPNVIEYRLRDVDSQSDQLVSNYKNLLRSWGIMPVTQNYGDDLIFITPHRYIQD